MNHNQLKNLFLSQSYEDAWQDYRASLNKKNFVRWDYVILTASNEAQAEAYRAQLVFRQENGWLPKQTRFLVLPDPDGKRVGSGGATLNVLREIWQLEHSFDGLRLLVIHSGGDSKRVPQYSACGKLFSPVPRELPDGRASTLFDEFMIGMAGVPSRMQEGMLVLSGDVLLLFNPLQIDGQLDGAAAISMKEHVSIGKNHGVFLNNGRDEVLKFLHKQSEETLTSMGAVNAQGNVDLDTGAILMGVKLVNALFSLISSESDAGRSVDDGKFAEFVNETSRISFYGDFLYPLAQDATLESYLLEEAEGAINDELLSCRRKIWEVLAPFSLKLFSLSPAQFIHFGTTRELLGLVTEELDDYAGLGWSRHVSSVADISNDPDASFAAHNAYIGRRTGIGKGAYIENSFILDQTQVGEGAIVSGLKLRGYQVPAHTVMHGLPICVNGKDAVVIRVYDVTDNPKDRLSGGGSFLGTTMEAFLQKNDLKASDLWKDEEDYLWFARWYPVCDDLQQALEMTTVLLHMAQGTASEAERNRWLEAPRTSLYESFNHARQQAMFDWERDLENRIISRRFEQALENGRSEADALRTFGIRGITEGIYRELMNDAAEASFSIRIRIYHALATYMKEEEVIFGDAGGEDLEQMCYKLIREEISRGMGLEDLHINHAGKRKIAEQEVNVKLPVRVNWGGGWTDTPPQCNELGGVVLNAAITLGGRYPVQVCVRKLDELQVEFESQDIGVYGTITELAELQNCNNPYDPFALHKAALLVCGVIPMNRDCDTSLKEVLQELGGGIYLSTQVVGIPKGSGLGTSSILSAACVKGIYRFMGQDISDARVSDTVLTMEQLMSTGGGWQDQVGGLVPGVKFITSRPGMQQKLDIEPLKLSEETKCELQERFALIYTGQRRLARNLLRDVVGGYIAGRADSLEALHEMRKLAALMRFQLEQGDVDAFAELLNEHWKRSLQLDGGTSNTCIDQIFLSCEDLIDAHFICGAGGGGFLQVILKRGITKETLRKRLHSVFQDSGVDVWESEFVWENTFC